MSNVTDEFIGKLFISPMLAAPENHEIVVIAVELEGGATILQTAVYEEREDGSEAWNCGQPFKTLMYWHSLRHFDTTCKIMAKPQNGEIVVMKCLMPDGSTVFQTAIFELGTKTYHCGQAYEKLVAWSSVPEVPNAKLLGIKRSLIH